MMSLYTLCLLLLIVLLSNFVPADGQDTSSTEISKKKILEDFPRYSQEDFSWCPWVSAQMILKYYGHTVSPQKIAVKTFELANQKWSQDAVTARYNGLPPELIHNYEDAIISLSDNSLEIEEITSRNKEELLDKIFQSIDRGSPIIILSTAPWLYDLFANIEPTVPWLYKTVGDKYPGGPHVSVIVGYSLDYETNPQLATHPFKLSLFGVLPSLVGEPPVLRIQDPNTATFGVDTYWLSYGKFFDKITAPGEDLTLITVNKKVNEIKSAEIPKDGEISAVDALSIGAQGDLQENNLESGKPGSSRVSSTYSNKDITGNWIISYRWNGKMYSHKMIIDAFNQNTGDFKGHGWVLGDPAYRWDISGTVDENNITYHIAYTILSPNFWINATGEFSSDILMSGKANAPGQSFMWNAAKSSNIERPNWDITGRWTYNYFNDNAIFSHKMLIDTFNPNTGDFKGHGQSLDNPAIIWDISGTVDGDNIAWHIAYTGLNPTYWTDAVGVISSATSMSGKANSPNQIATWNATKNES